LTALPPRTMNMLSSSMSIRAESSFLPPLARYVNRKGQASAVLYALQNGPGYLKLVGAQFHIT